jgi:serine/threonine-protein kinase RsbW
MATNQPEARESWSYPPILEDSSPSFDPLDVPPPADLEWESADRPAGGLGVFLALQGVDEFEHRWVNNCNYNVFVQYIRP